MDKRKKIIAGTAGAIAAAGLCIGGIFYVSREAPELIDDILSGDIKSILSGEDEEEKEQKKKDDNIDAASAGEKEKADGEADDKKTNGQQSETKHTNFVDNGGASVSGTSASQSFRIKMSDLCTFTDPAGLSFDTRYVLHGGSSCTPARKASASGYSCKEAYVVLYASGGKAAGEYQCFVMASEADARGLAAQYAGYYNGGGTSTGRWGDVVYIYSSGSYVQTSIDTYADAGAISSATPEAYLGMAFYFGGMSEYHVAESGSGSSGGHSGTQTPSKPGSSVSPGKPGSSDKPSDPGTSDKPGTPGKPSDPDNPQKPGEEDPDEPASGLSAAATKKEDCYPIRMSEKYLYEDPEDLDYDTRYVIYAGPDSMAASMGGYAGTKVSRVYEIVYTKNGKGAAEYKAFAAADAAGAKKMAEMFGGEAVENIYIQYSDAKTLEQMIQYGVLYAGLDGTVEAYLQNMLDTEGYKIYQRTDSDVEEPDVDEPGGDGPGGDQPEEPGLGTAQADSFDIRITDTFTYEDPEELQYDRRYAVYGGSGCAVALPYQADGVQEAYDIVYSKDEKVAGEYRVFVLETEEQAQALEQKFLGMGMEQTDFLCEGNVLVQNCGTTVQDMIDMYYQFGMLSEATPEAYMQMLVSTPQEQGGMTECKKDTAAEEDDSDEEEKASETEKKNESDVKAAKSAAASADSKDQPDDSTDQNGAAVKSQTENSSKEEVKQEDTPAAAEPEDPVREPVQEPETAEPETAEPEEKSPEEKEESEAEKTLQAQAGQKQADETAGGSSSDVAE